MTRNNIKQFNRRWFTGSVMAAGYSLFAAPRASRAQSPNEKLGVAILGAGGRGSSHIKAYLDDDRTEILYVVDPDGPASRSRARYIEEKQGRRPQTTVDLRKAFDDQSVDIVSIATPNHWHGLSGVWAMQAGKDVYVEKPISHNIAEGAAVMAAAEKYQRICQVGTQCRSNPAIIDAVAFLERGGIGEVNFARGLCYKRRKSIGAWGDYPLPKNVDFNLWSGPAEYTDPKLTRSRFHYDWHWQRLYGNGDSGNQGPHQTDIARWGLGLDRQPNAVISYGGRLGYQAERQDDSYIDAGDTPNTQVSIYDYGEKSIVFETRGLDVNQSDDEEINRLFGSTRGNKIGVIFYGSDGYLVQDSYTHCIALDKKFEPIQEFTGGGNHFANFVDVCLSRKTNDLNADSRVGHLSASLSHLGNISLELGENNRVSVEEALERVSAIKSLDDNEQTLIRTIQHLQKNRVNTDDHPIAMGPHLSFSPESEVFPDSELATSLCRRGYRKPFVCPTADQV